jgi:dTDP-glucose 4,6-dehydratase
MPAASARSTTSVAMPSRRTSTWCARSARWWPRADGVPREAQIAYVKDRPGHDRRYAIDSSKLRRETGWAPSRTFEQGLAETVDWYLAHEAWVQRVLDGSYRMERIGVEA